MYKIRTLSLSLLIVAAVFSGCDDKEDENQPEIKVENPTALTQTVFADETDGKSEVTFVTTGAWISTVTANSQTVTWLSIEPKSGNAGTNTISISLEPNATGSDRTAVITISCNGEDIAITVTQNATKEDGTLYEPDTGDRSEFLGYWHDDIVEFNFTESLCLISVLNGYVSSTAGGSWVYNSNLKTLTINMSTPPTSVWEKWTKWQNVLISENSWSGLNVSDGNSYVFKKGMRPRL